MLAAVLGVGGVLVGVVLTQLFTTSANWRATRLDAMVRVAVASGRVIGAHERFHELLFVSGDIPPVNNDRAVAALAERNDAYYDWRSARSRIEILIATDSRLDDAMRQFDKWRAQATRFVHAYLQDGEGFDRSKYSDLETEAWDGMRAARKELLTVSRVRSELDTRWWRRWTRLRST